MEALAPRAEADEQIRTFLLELFDRVVQVLVAAAATAAAGGAMSHGSAVSSLGVETRETRVSVGTVTGTKTAISHVIGGLETFDPECITEVFSFIYSYQLQCPQILMHSTSVHSVPQVQYSMLRSTLAVTQLALS